MRTNQLFETQNTSLMRDLYTGCVLGCSVWMAYGSVEFFFSATLPIFLPVRRLGADIVSPWYWPLEAELLLAYAILGVVSGLAIVSVLRLLRKRVEEHASLFTLFLVSSYLLNLVIADVPTDVSWSSITPTLLLFALLCSTAVGALKGFELLANPLIASFCLIAPLWMLPYVTGKFGPGFWRELVVGPGSLVALVGVLALISRKTSVSRRELDRLIWHRTFPVAGILLVLQFFSVLVFGSADLDLQGLEEADGRQPGRPNVLIVTMDTTRADHFSLYGYERDTSPNLKELAKNSVLYLNATAAGDMTLTSHASIFTGLYASWHGAHRRFPEDWGVALGPQFDTLAEILAREGYLTAAVVANLAYLNSSWGMNQGFQIYDERVPLLFLGRLYLLRPGVVRLLECFTSSSQFYRVSRTATEISQEARAIVSYAKESNQPFFLFLNYMDAHTPYLPPDGFDRAFEGKSDDFRQRRYEELIKRAQAGQRDWSDKERDHLVSQYDGSIAYIDNELAGLVAHLKALRLFEKTLIIITSDHGEAFGEHGLFEHGFSVHADQVHVPLLVKYPGQEAKETVKERVSHADLLPTVVDVVNARSPAVSHGESLRRPLVDARRKVFAESFPYDSGGLSQDRIERAVLQGDWKLILSNTGSRELFRLSEDKGEELNVYWAREEAAALEDELNRWIDQIPEAHPVPGDESNDDDEVLERLRSLGYVR